MAWLVVTHRGDLATTLGAASLPWLAAATVGMACAMAVLAWGWADTIDLVADERPSRTRLFAGYFAGELGKYLPGGVFSVVGRAEVGHRLGLTRAVAYTSVVLSLLLTYSAAGVVAGGLAVVALAVDPVSVVTIVAPLALPLSLVALHPRLIDRALQLARRLTRRAIDLQVPPWRSSVAVAIRYLPAWLLVAASTWAAARALVPHPSAVRVPLAAVLSWTAGFVAGPAPAGAGVREATFVAFCGLPAAEGAAVALAARAASLVADVGAGTAALAWLRP